MLPPHPRVSESLQKVRASSRGNIFTSYKMFNQITDETREIANSFDIKQAIKVAVEERRLSKW